MGGSTPGQSSGNDYPFLRCLFPFRVRVCMHVYARVFMRVCVFFWLTALQLTTIHANEFFAVVSFLFP